jgi:hypothetical protein
MKEQQMNITADYKGDFTEIEETPTLNGKRMGLFEKKRFNYWRERNRHFMQQIAAKGLDVDASYEVIKNDFLQMDESGNEYVRTQAHDDYLMGGGKCYGGNVGDTVTFESHVYFRQDGKEQEIRIRKLLMICRNKQGNVTFEMLFGGFDYDNFLEDFFADFMESPCYLLKKQ